ncbi:hypothetical protein B0H19DRAFT_1293404, partial [Mycena capillaripes]
ILHILNLIAKAVIQFFFKQLKRKKTVKVSKGRGNARGRGRGRGRARGGAPITPAPSRRSTAAESEEAVADEGDDLTPEEEELAGLLGADDSADDDETADQELHDTHTARSIRGKAVAHMAELGVVISERDNRQALGIFPKVAGLARKVHDSGSVASVFNGLVDTAKAAGKIKTDKTALDRRCPTRWNADFDCLNAHSIFKVAVEQLTATSALKLSSFRLTDEQWDLVDELSDVLSLFDEMTLHFSQSETPLISDSIGALEDLLTSLRNVRDDDKTSDVVRVAACAGVMVAEKYISLTDECEVYSIAIVMFPDKKLDWFRSRKWKDEDIERIKKLAIDRWEESYKAFSKVSTAPPTAEASSSASAGERRNRWKVVPTTITTTPNGPDTIQAYLAEPPISTSSLAALGGPISYWFLQEESTPSLARMGSDFCSAPGMS